MPSEIYTFCDFSVPYAINLFIASCVISGVYYYSGSIWLAIGVHKGINWFGFSFVGGAENWKLGALIRIEIQDIPTGIYYATGPLIGIAIFLLVRLADKKGFFEKIRK